jgi:hypothetical protein
MVRPGRDRLSGWVEVDETYLGGLEEGVAGRQQGEKALIVIAAQAVGKRIGRIRLRAIQDASRSRGDCAPGKSKRFQQATAPGSSDSVLIDTLVSRHAPRRRKPRSPCLLPGRVHCSSLGGFRIHLHLVWITKY